MDCKVFQMMPDIIILKVRKFRQPTANRFSTARQKPIGGGGGGGQLAPQPEREWTYQQQQFLIAHYSVQILSSLLKIWMQVDKPFNI